MFAAGCTTSGPVAASKRVQTDTVRATVGTSLVGARGATEQDQAGIDRTAARLCAASAWTPAECTRHGAESRAK